MYVLCVFQASIKVSSTENGIIFGNIGIKNFVLGCCIFLVEFCFCSV